MPQIVVNGQEQQLPHGANVCALIAQLNFTGKAVAVEINKQLVPRRRHEQTLLRDGDVVEVVTLVGGG